VHDYTNALFAYIIYFQAGRHGQFQGSYVPLCVKSPCC